MKSFSSLLPLIATLMAFSLTAHAGEATKSPPSETDDLEPKIIEGPNGTLLTTPIIPKARDRIGEKNTIVLIAGKPVKILCAGKVDYAIFGNDGVLKDLSRDKDSDVKPCDELPDHKCGIICEPKIDHGFTNLMLKDSRTVYHRDLEIRGPKSKDYAKALKNYKPEITLSDE